MGFAKRVGLFMRVQDSMLCQAGLCCGVSRNYALCCFIKIGTKMEINVQLQQSERYIGVDNGAVGRNLWVRKM